jgi:hypothetical protein
MMSCCSPAVRRTRCEAGGRFLFASVKSSLHRRALAACGVSLVRVVLLQQMALAAFARLRGYVEQCALAVNAWKRSAYAAEVRCCGGLG